MHTANLYYLFAPKKEGNGLFTTLPSSSYLWGSETQLYNTTVDPIWLARYDWNIILLYFLLAFDSAMAFLLKASFALSKNQINLCCFPQISESHGCKYLHLTWHHREISLSTIVWLPAIKSRSRKLRHISPQVDCEDGLMNPAFTPSSNATYSIYWRM